MRESGEPPTPANSGFVVVSYGLARALTTQQVDNAVPDTLGNIVAIAMADTEKTELSSPDRGTDPAFSVGKHSRRTGLQTSSVPLALLTVGIPMPGWQQAPCISIHQLRKRIYFQFL